MNPSLALVVLLFLICLRLGAQPAPTNVLQTAAEIRQLTPAQAAMQVTRFNCAGY